MQVMGFKGKLLINLKLLLGLADFVKILLTVKEINKDLLRFSFFA